MFLAIFSLIDLALLHNAFQLLVNNSLAVGNECEKRLRWGQYFCGKVIQKLCADFDVKIDIDDDGNVFICGLDLDKANACVQVISTIVNPPEVGAIYKGKVVRIMNFGAFVEIAPGKDGMVHISKLDNHRVEKVEDVVSVGDEIIVKVMEIDNQGRINLSRKDALADIEAKRKAQAQGW